MPEPDKNLTSGQEGDAVAVYLAEAAARVQAVRDAEEHMLDPDLWDARRRSADDVPRLLAAVAVPLRLHHPLPALDPRYPNLRVCDRCDQPWPCYEHEQITRALTGEIS